MGYYKTISLNQVDMKKDINDVIFHTREKVQRLCISPGFSHPGK